VAAAGQGVAAVELAGGFFLKIEPRLFAAFATFCALWEMLGEELF
jgi:hypothetical protein